MKMPRRPFYPVKLPPDIFGLQRPTILEQACETKEETQKRVAAVEHGVGDAFKAAIWHLGDVEARRLFKHVMRHTKRGRGKMLAQDRDDRLLKEYDAAVQKGESIAAVARRLRAEDTKLGATNGAIAAQFES